MKRTLSLILAVIMVVLSVPMTAVEVNAADNKVYTKTIETPYFSQKPTIDGNISEEEWGAPSVVLNTSAAAQPGSEAPSEDNTFLWYYHTYDSTTGTYSDIDMQAKSQLSNLTIKLWFRWDEYNYYMAAVVDDPDGYYLPSGRANIWNGDCLEFRLDPMGPNSYAAYKNPGYNYKTDDFDVSMAAGNAYAPWAYRQDICNIGLGMIKNARGAWEYQAYDMADAGTGNFTAPLLTNDPKKLGPDGALTAEIGLTYTNLASEFKMKYEAGKNYYEIAVPWAYIDQWHLNTVGVNSVWGISVANLMGKESAGGYYAYFQWGYGICGAQHQQANLRVTVGGTNALILTDKDAHTGAVVADLPVYTAPTPGYPINYIVDMHGMDAPYLGSSDEIVVEDGDFYATFDVAYLADFPVAPEQTHIGVRLGEGYGKIAGWDGATGEFFITTSLWGNGIGKDVPYATSDDTFKWEPGEWHKMGVKVADETVTVYFDGEAVLEDTDPSYKSFVSNQTTYQIIIYNQGDFVLDNICFYDGAGNPIQEFTHNSDDTAWNTSDMKLQAMNSAIEMVRGECKNLNESSEYGCLFVEGTTYDGLECTICSFCGTISEILHNIKYVEAKAPTCTEIGWEAYEYCTVCDYTTYVEIPAEHRNTSVFGYIAPTCTNNGFTGSVFCRDCKTTIENNKSIPATGHQNTEIINYVENTCTTDGYTGDTYCYDCLSVIEYGEIIPASGHINTENIGYVAPTCSEVGYTGATYCLDCESALQQGEIIPATGHINTEIIGYVAPTCTDTGYTGVVYCLDCGTTVQNGEIIPAGHQYEKNGVCINCGEKKAASEGLKFTYSDGICYVSGIGTCTDTDIVIPEKSPAGDVVKGIDDYAFYNCLSLTSVIIPDCVTTIGVFAFRNCTSLSSIAIPDSVTNIDEMAFYNCSNLTDVYYSGSKPQLDCISIGRGNDCLTNATIYYAKGDGTSKGLAFTSNGDGTCYVSGIGTCTDTDLVIPSKSPEGDVVTGIGEMAFYSCDITNVVIPDSVTVIGRWAFDSCTSLTNVVIGNGVTTIGEWAFAACTSLISMTIPDSVTDICNFAFASCENLVSVNIPNSVTTLGNWVFGECTSLTNVVIPNSITSISEGAFFSCSSLTSITLPEGITNIGKGAFGCCYSLSSITIPDSVTTICDYAFHYCESLTDVYYGGSEDQWNDVSIGIYNTFLIQITTTIHYKEVVAIIPGDANGDGTVDGADLQLLQRSIAGLSAEMDETAADANGDGSIDGADVMYISRLIAGLSV